MNQPASIQQEELAAPQAPPRPPGIWLTQAWLLLNILPILLGVAWVGFETVRAFLRGETSIGLSNWSLIALANVSNERLMALLQLNAVFGMSILAVFTFWALQKRKRSGKWLALLFTCLVVAKNSYYFAVNPPGLWSIIGSPIFLFQLIMLYRFTLGKSENAFLSKMNPCLPEIFVDLPTQPAYLPPSFLQGDNAMLVTYTNLFS
jgi:hypothetical protein